MLGGQGRWDSELLKRNLGGRQRSFPRSLIEFCLCYKCSFPLSLRPSATSTLSPRTSQNGFIWGRGICQSAQSNLQVGTGRAAIALRHLLYLVFTRYPLLPRISQILDFKQQKWTLTRFNEKGIWKDWRGTGGLDIRKWAETKAVPMFQSTGRCTMEFNRKHLSGTPPLHCQEWTNHPVTLCFTPCWAGVQLAHPACRERAGKNHVPANATWGEVCCRSCL